MNCMKIFKKHLRLMMIINIIAIIIWGMTYIKYGNAPGWPLYLNAFVLGVCLTTYDFFKT